MDIPLLREKLDQAVALLDEYNLDVWLTFVRETSLTADPALQLICDLDLVWHSAFIISRAGECIAIVGRYDAENLIRSKLYTHVIGYDQSLRTSLRNTIEGLNPQTIALNYSMSDPAADGLTFGLWATLQEVFADTPYAGRFVSAEKFLAALRGRKSVAEVERIRLAIRATEKLFARLSNTLKPGMSEKRIADFLHAEREQLGLGTAWDAPYCPTVNAGPDSPVGHTLPGECRTARGHLLHVDFGVRRDSFCSDLQRMWYFLDKGEHRAPEDVQRAWDACWAALDAGAARLRPGAIGWEVDAAAREALVNAGYPEYQHALGHQLGRVAHDGAVLLGPRWDRYGQAPYGEIEAGNVFTLELGVFVPERGYLGLEEDVLVTASGIEWLSKPQRKLWLV